MRSRDEIFNDLDGIPTYVEHASKATSLCLEVLLDIREMLIPLANPIYTVTTEEFNHEAVDVALMKARNYSSVANELRRDYFKNGDSFSKRVTNSLSRYCVNQGITIEKLKSMSEDELKEIKDIGPWGIKLIKKTFGGVIQ